MTGQLKIKLLILALSVLLNGASSAPKKLGFDDRKQVVETVELLVEPIMLKYFDKPIYNDYPTSRYFLTFEFDHKKFDADWASWKSASIAKREESLAEQQKIMNETYNALLEKMQADTSVKEEPKKNLDTPESSSKQRFGRLNVDLNSEKLESILDEAVTPAPVASEKPKITLQIPTITHTPVEPFSYDSLSYVRNLKLELTVPDAIGDEIINKASESIVNALKSQSLDIKRQSISVVKTKPKPKPKPEPKPAPPPPEPITVEKWLLSPNNPSVGILISAIVLGLCALICIILLAKVIGKIAGSIAELKPEGGSEGGGSGGDSVGFEPEEVIAAADDDSGGDYGGGQSSAQISAMTSEMKTIRDQLAEIVLENPDVASELLRDLCYERHGMEDFRDLLSFSGYNTLKEAMQLLPDSVMIQLQNYIEDNREAQVNLIRGCEVAQRIYRDTVSKISLKSESGEHIHSLKNTLIRIDDQVIDQTVQADATPAEITVLLKLLSVERGNRLMKSLEPKVLRDACELLDQPIDNEEALVKGLVEKLEKAQSGVQVTTQLQKRFILRLAKTASIDEEAALLELIAQDNWDLKQEILRTRFLYNYIPYLPPENLRGIIEAFPLSKRAEILFVVDEEVKSAVLSQYKEGSKVYDMINDELENVTKNAKRRDHVLKSKAKLIDDLLDKVRQEAARSDTVVVETLRNEFAKLGVEIPEKYRNETSVDEQAA